MYKFNTHQHTHLPRILCSIALCTLIAVCFSQVEGHKEITKDEAETLGNIKQRGIKFGVSLGFNKTTDGVWDAVIAKTDTTLKLQNLESTSFMLSSTVSFAILSKWLGGGAWYRKLNAAGEPVGNPYFVPSGFSMIATINLATFNSAFGGSGLFNQKLDGGLGLAYTFGDDVQVGVTYEMLSFRQPRNFVLDLRDKPIEVGGQKLTDLRTEDDSYFINKYIPSISIKLIYILNNEKP